MITTDKCLPYSSFKIKLKDIGIRLEFSCRNHRVTAPGYAGQS